MTAYRTNIKAYNFETGRNSFVSISLIADWPDTSDTISNPAIIITNIILVGLLKVSII